jgi:hypothetical protein
MPAESITRWKESFDEAQNLFKEAKITVDIHHISL